MKATVKGLTFEVSVNGKVACGEWTAENINKDIDTDHSNNSSGKGLDVSFGATIKTGVEDYQGEIDLRELTESIKTILDTSISKQVEKQLENRFHDFDKNFEAEVEKQVKKQLDDNETHLIHK